MCNLRMQWNSKLVKIKMATFFKNHNEGYVDNYLIWMEKDFLNKKQRERSIKENIYWDNMRI